MTGMPCRSVASSLRTRNVTRGQVYGAGKRLLGEYCAVAAGGTPGRGSAEDHQQDLPTRSTRPRHGRARDWPLDGYGIVKQTGGLYMGEFALGQRHTSHFLDATLGRDDIEVPKLPETRSGAMPGAISAADTVVRTAASYLTGQGPILWFEDEEGLAPQLPADTLTRIYCDHVATASRRWKELERPRLPSNLVFPMCHAGNGMGRH